MSVSSRVIHAACGPGEVRVAVSDHGTLIDYAIWRPGNPDGVGDMYRARVRAKVPAMAGAFVQTGGGLDGFLPDSAGAAHVSEGMSLVVRVVRASQGGKGPRLSAEIAGEYTNDFVASGPPGLIARGPGAVERLAALYPDAPVLIDDAGVAARLRARLGDRLHVVPAVWTDELASSVDGLSRPAADLPGGARLHIYPTPALTALDVDLGALSAERRSKPSAQHAANVAVLPAIAREIRLRNLGGAILLDLGGISIRKRQGLAPALERALAEDPLAPRFLGFTALGLAEILRPRNFPPLHELLASPHAVGLAGLRAAEAACLAQPGHQPWLFTSTGVFAALTEDRMALDEFTRRTGHRLKLELDACLPAGTWRL